MSNKPAFVLHITLPPGYIDVNLSPDKREVVIVHDKYFLDDFRELLDDLFAPTRSTLDTSHAVQRDITDIFPISLPPVAVHSKSTISPTNTKTSKSSSDGSLCDEAAQKDVTTNAEICAATDLSQSALGKRPQSIHTLEEENEVVLVNAPRKRTSTPWRISADDIRNNSKPQSTANIANERITPTSDVKLQCNVNASMEEAAKLRNS